MSELPMGGYDRGNRLDATVYDGAKSNSNCNLCEIFVQTRACPLIHHPKGPVPISPRACPSIGSKPPILLNDLSIFTPCVHPTQDRPVSQPESGIPQRDSGRRELPMTGGRELPMT